MTQQVHHELSKSIETKKFLGVNTIQNGWLPVAEVTFVRPKSLQIVIWNRIWEW